MAENEQSGRFAYPREGKAGTLRLLPLGSAKRGRFAYSPWGGQSGDASLTPRRRAKRGGFAYSLRRQSGTLRLPPGRAKRGRFAYCELERIGQQLIEFRKAGGGTDLSPHKAQKKASSRSAEALLIAPPVPSNIGPSNEHLIGTPNAAPSPKRCSIAEVTYTEDYLRDRILLQQVKLMLQERSSATSTSAFGIFSVRGRNLVARPPARITGKDIESRSNPRGSVREDLRRDSRAVGSRGKSGLSGGASKSVHDSRKLHSKSVSQLPGDSPPDSPAIVSVLPDPPYATPP
jgi:hypothetical protein